MSREIKFRGYVEKIDDIGIDVPHEGHFVYGNLVHGNNFDCIVGGLIEATEEYAALEWWQTIQQGAAEQFTGLKDKDGKNIYEGDIVKFHGNNDDLAVVRFGEFGVPDATTEEYVDTALGFYFEPQGSLKDIAPFNMTVPVNALYSKKCMIVGNIHEDKDLLEVDK